MELTKQGERIFIDTFNRCAVNFNDELLQFRQRIIEVMREHGDIKFINSDEEMREWAIKAFLAEVKIRHDHYSGQLEALEEARGILTQEE